MTMSPRHTQGQRQTLQARQIQAIGMLQLSNEGLAELLTRKTASNPLLRLHRPAGIAGPDDTGAQLAEADSGLFGHVERQLGLILPAGRDLAIALAFVEALDANGWLDRPIPDIAAAAGCSTAAADDVLARLQQGIEPTGLFARDLADCLRLQAAELGYLTLGMQALLANLPLLATGGVVAVARVSGLAITVLETDATRLRRLNPRPGLAFGGGEPPVRAPDVIVTRRDGVWHVELNRSTLPAVTILPAPDPSLRAAQREAEWLALAVERRNRTVLEVCRAVLLRQSGFLENGPAALLPLTRQDIAAELRLHGTTVGRVARDLLVDTPQGLRSLCSFFDFAPRGSTVASSAIRQRLAQMIAAENPGDPLDDAELARRLSQQGMPVARRTVAKFRDDLRIPARRLRLHRDAGY